MFIFIRFVIQSMGKLLNKSDIFAKKALDPKTVSVPEWGGDVKYKPMTMLERKQVRKKASETKTVNGEVTVEVDQELLEIWAIIMCALDPDGKPMFTPDDVTVLEEQMAAGAITTLSTAILRASGLAPDAFRESENSTKTGS